MCGLVGMAGKEINPGILLAMRDSLRHRGPDDCGLWVSDDGRIGFGHRRLSILDLSEAGRQPLWDATHSVCVAFNGEIYNFLELRKELEADGASFLTRTDTEVLAAAYMRWGETFMERLNGMFAFALYDRRNRTLLLARDRVGKKPLYYWADGGQFVFASELRALSLHPGIPREIDLMSLNFYLARGYVPRERSLIAGVCKLLPGHLLTLRLDSGKWQIKPYWTLPRPEAASQPLEDLVKQLGELLIGSTRMRLVADVPVGVLLSGGLDSSLVVAAAARGGAGAVRTFTITHPRHKAYDESERARLVASAFGTQHTELPAEEAELSIEEAVRLCDEPMADSSFIPTVMVCRLARKYVTVALGGDGGDELFAGYNHYRTALRLNRTWSWVPPPVRHAAGALGSIFPLGGKGRGTLVALGNYNGVNYVTRTPFFDLYARRQLLKPEILAALGDGIFQPESLDLWEGLAGFSPLSRYTRYDVQNYLSEDILVKVDRASMSTSLEVRAPWLDYKVVEFAFRSVPDMLKTNLFENRIIERRLASQWLPRGLETRVKKGFSIPLENWLNRPEAFDCRSLPAIRHLMDQRMVENVWEGLARGRSNAQRAFALLVLDRWLAASGSGSLPACTVEGLSK